MNFKRFIMVSAITISAVFSTACTRITDGEVGVRITQNGTIEGQELGTGWHQDIVGSILQFPVRDIPLQLTDRKPTTIENSPLKDFDATVVYNVNPTAVAELYKNKSRAFHARQGQDVLLMFNYMQTIADNAIVKVVRKYKQLEVADNRSKIEVELREAIVGRLKEEGLDTMLIISAVQVVGTQPNDVILQAATNLVKSENELKIAQNQIALAEAEAKRQEALSKNSQQTIAYMQAQAQLTIAEAVKAGKVQTIIIPHNLTALGTLNK